MRNTLMGAVALMAVGLTGAPALAKTPKDTLVIVREISSISEWDPAVSQILDVTEMNNDLFDRLVGFDPRNPEKLQPMVAESYDVSADGKTITFKIRKGIRFHSGNELTSKDVLYSFRRLMLLGREPSSSMRTLGFTKENVDASLSTPDDHTFVMQMSEQYAPSFAISLLGSAAFAIVDSKLVMEHEKDGDFGSAWLSNRANGEMSAGSGPFKIATYRASDIVMLERNDDYWLFTPEMKRVIIRHVPEAGTQRLLLEQGDADVAFNLTSTDAEALEGNKNTRVEYHPGRKILYFGFNTLIEPFDDPRVTQAMKYLIDYDGLSKTIMKNIGTVHQSFIPASYLGSLTETPFSYDVEKAKALLAEAGYPDGFEMTFTAYNRKPEMDLATSFQATALPAGVKVEIVNMPTSQSIPLYREQKLQALQLSYSGGYADPHSTASKFTFNPIALPGADPAGKWPSELSWRLGYAPVDLTALTVEASKELDENKRIEMYHELQRRAWEEAPFAWQFQVTQALGLGANVHDYRYGARGADVSFAAVRKD